MTRYYTPEDAERAGFVARHDVEYRGRVRSQGEALASRQWQRGTDADVAEGWELNAPPEAEVRYLQGRLDRTEARMAVLLAALNVALNDDDPEALEGARMALAEVRREDLTLLHDRDNLRAALADEQAHTLAAKVAADGYRQRAERAEARLAAVEALADRWEAADGEPARCCDLAIMNACNAHGRAVRAALEGP
jgi:FMN phosphatase YigB (HAD superfamily)